LEKAATMLSAKASVVAAKDLMLVATRGGSGYGDQPRNITKWSSGARGLISLLFWEDKMTNLRWLALGILK
jgi:hypothetical protein